MNVIIALTRTKTTEQSVGTINIYAGKIIKVFDFVDSGSLSKVLFYDEGSNVKEVVVDESPSDISTDAENLIAVISNDSDVGTFYINAEGILGVEDNVTNPLDEGGSKIRRIIYYAEGANNDELFVTDSVATIKTNVGAVAIKGQGVVVADAGAITATDPTTPAALSQSVAPAGGTGATAGAYDNASNRDLAIASINAGRDDIIALRAEVVSYEVAISALFADVTELRTQLNALLASLRTVNVIKT